MIGRIAMKTFNSLKQGRRGFLGAAGGITVSAAFGWLPEPARGADLPNAALPIGVIGSGKIGGTLGELWVKGGYSVVFSSLELEHDKELAQRLGPGARAGTPEQAAKFGEVLLVSVPYKALPQLGRDLASLIKGKVVLDTCNPIQARDGEMAVAAREKGAGAASAELLPGARLVRAFNSVPYASLRSEAHRSGDRIAVPLAADDEGALEVATRLVQDAGFEPVVVGGLKRAKDFDVGTAVFGKALTANELRKALGIAS
jgi:8-hydroxy-5-deazaflavin:NADPH oxidoreductase